MKTAPQILYECTHDDNLRCAKEDILNAMRVFAAQEAEQKLNDQFVELTRKHQEEIREVRNKAYNDGYSQGFKHGVYKI